MQNINKILVALDYSYMDEILLSNCQEIIKVIGLSEIHFIHVIPKYISKVNIPARLDKIEQDLSIKVRQLLKDKIDNFHFSNGQLVNYKVHVKEGQASRIITEMANEHGFDLLIVGKKILSEGSGLTPRRIAQNIKCDIMIIPQNAIPTFNNVLIPMDFSNDSVIALIKAIQWQQESNCNIQLVHILLKYRAGYYIDIDLNNEHYLFYQNVAEKEWKSIVDDLGIDSNKYPITYIKNKRQQKANILLDYIDNHIIDHVVIGAKGKSNFQKILYGSLTEIFVEKNIKATTLVVR